MPSKATQTVLIVFWIFTLSRTLTVRPTAQPSVRKGPATWADTREVYTDPGEPLHPGFISPSHCQPLTGSHMPQRPPGREASAEGPNAIAELWPFGSGEGGNVRPRQARDTAKVPGWQGLHPAGEPVPSSGTAERGETKEHLSFWWEMSTCRKG